MEFSTASSLDKRINADVLVLPFFEGEKLAECTGDVGILKSAVLMPIDSGDFKGKSGETTVLYLQEQKERRCILLGLGSEEKLSVENLRRAYSSLAKLCRKKEMRKLNILVPSVGKIPEESVARGICEGILLANYVFDELKEYSLIDDPTVVVEKLSFVGVKKNFLAYAKKAGSIIEGVSFAKDLVNGNADVVIPKYLADVADKIDKDFPNVTTRVLDKKHIEKEGMELLLAVSRGSKNDPYFINMTYRGAPKSKDLSVIVGKGVTFDSGGLNLKPTGSMETMKCDMAGAAAALGTVFVAAKLGLSVNVSAVVSATENMIDAHSYKCGDVYKGYSGKTVEVINTDAEGRLTLAESLSYACKTMSPTRIIDIATLTGAMEIALGTEVSGYMSKDDSLAKMLENAGEDTYERIWRLPMYEEYREQLKSDIADIKNTGGRAASSITSSLFLNEFVDKKIPWAHIDIAGTAFLDKESRYHSKYATGWGVRLLIDFLEKVQEENERK